MPDWLSAVAQGLFWVLAMTLTMRWLARGRQRGAPSLAAAACSITRVRSSSG